MNEEESQKEEKEHLPTHVVACGERYKGINARLARIEKIGGTAILILILQLLAQVSDMPRITVGM